jgi:hypothetical protein
LITALLLAGCTEEPGGDPLPPSDGWSGTPPADPVALGQTCELPWFECSEGWCNPDVLNGLPRCEGVGACVEPPLSCDDIDEPVCGCDGQLYANACAAASVEIATQPADACTAPAGRFACGAHYCEIDTHYCKHMWTGGANPQYFECLPLDCEAGLSGCECLMDPFLCGDPDSFWFEGCEDLEGGGTELQCSRH